VSFYNGFASSKVALRDDGRILGISGKTDELSMLCGEAYYRGFISAGWYFTGSYYVVSAIADAAGVIKYSLTTYTTLPEAQLAYDAIVLAVNPLNSKVLINTSSMVLRTTATTKHLAIGYYY